MPKPSRRSLGLLAVVVAILLTLVSVSGVFVSPKPHPPSFATESAVISNQFPYEDPCLSPDGVRIAFSNNASGSFQIWTVSLQGRQLTRLTYSQGDSRFPSYGPDGGYIAFYHYLGNSKEIVLMKSDGTDAKVLSETAATDNAIAWSPDGTMVAFDEVVGGENKVVVWKLDSNRIVFSMNGSSPAWSQDGKLMAFVTENGDRSTLSTTDFTGNTTERVSTLGRLAHPTFFENSTAIVFLNCENDTWTIDYVKLKGATVSNLLRAPVGGLLLQTWTPDVSSQSIPVAKPDGTSVIFSGRVNQSLMDLFEVIPDTVVKVPAGALTVKYPGTIINRLTKASYEYVGVPAWSHDGKLIVFSVRNQVGGYDLMLISYITPKPQSRYG